jgi:YggT family protein
LSILTWAVIARSLMSWFPVDQSSPLVQMLHRVTDPIIEPIGRVMPQNGMIDFSPLVAMFGLIMMQYMVSMLVAPA